MGKQLSIKAVRIKALREREGFTQEALADKLNISKQTVSNYETDAREPDIEKLLKMSEIFKVSVDYILGKSNYFNSRDEAAQEIGLTKDAAEVLSRFNDYEKIGFSEFVVSMYSGWFVSELLQYKYTTLDNIREKLALERDKSTHEKKDAIYGLEVAKLEALGPYAFKRGDVERALNALLEQLEKDAEAFRKRKEGK